jgi:phenylacetic acid degradation operon negative regulatory protein
VFDLPVHQQKLRHRLIRWLRLHGFGYLQDSVWITPDPVEAISESLKPFRDDAESFTILDCRCAKGFRDSSLVMGAWPFEGINEKYKQYERFAAGATKTLKGKPMHPRDLFGLLRTERQMWAAAFDLDPLLPMTLWPKKYEGHRAWQTRTGLLHLLQRQAGAK